MKVVVMSYRSIAWLVKPFVYLHQKYWGCPVTLLAEEDYSEGAFDFFQPPDSIAMPKSKEIPAYRFSDVLVWYLRQIEDEHILLMMGDFLIYQPVDVVRLQELQEYMHEHDVVRGQVGDDNFCQFSRLVDHYQHLDIYEGGFRISSLNAALWNRQMLLDMIPLNADPWAVENRCGESIEQRGLRSIATMPGIMACLNVIRSREATHPVLPESVYREIEHLLPMKIHTFSPERDNLTVMVR